MKIYVLILAVLGISSLICISLIANKKSPQKHDYYIDINDSMTIVYDLNGKFVTTIPFDSNSLFDKEMMKINQ